MRDINNRIERVERQLEAISLKRDGFSSMNCVRQDEIDIRELVQVVWNGRWTLVATVLLFSVASFLYALSLPNIYRSEALLSPAEENSVGGLAGLGGQLGGLAGLAGISLGGAKRDKATVAIEVLKSREFIYKFIRESNMQVPLMAATGWNPSSNKLILDPDVYDEQKKEWVREVPPTKLAAPSMDELYRKYMKIFTVTQDNDTGFVSVAFEHFSPDMIKIWVDQLVAKINHEIKARDVSEANKSIQYLTEQLSKTPVADMKAVFYELIEEQTKVVMFAAVREEYVFKTIDRAVVPELRSSPNRLLVCVLGTLLGGFLGLVFIFGRQLVWQGGG